MSLRIHQVAAHRIMRRLRRHTNLTTLFRVPEPSLRNASPVETAILWGEPVNSAGQPAAQPEPGIPTPASSPVSKSQDINQASPQTPPTGVPSAMPLTSPLPVEPEKVLVPPPATPISPPSSTVQSSADDDVTWRRLQKIMALHQEKEAREQAASEDASVAPVKPAQSASSPDVAPSVQRQPATQSPSQLQLNEVDQARQIVPPTKPVELSSSSVIPGSLLRAGTEARDLETKPNPSQPGLSLTSEPVGLSTPSAGSLPAKPIIPSQPAATVSAPMTPLSPSTASLAQRVPAERRSSSGERTGEESGSSAHLKPEQPTPTQDNDPAISDQPAAALEGQGSADKIATPTPGLSSKNFGDAHEFDPFRGETGGEVEPEGTALQLLPLEAVWAVQRDDDPFSQPANAEPASAPANRPLPAPVDPALAQNIQQTLQQVNTKEPTYAPVEVVMPRRARPFQNSAVETSKSSQPTTRTDTSEYAAPDVPQPHRVPEQRADMVATDIGPLPSDLWELLGQAPPQSPEPPSAQTEAIFRQGEEVSTTASQVIQPQREPAPAGFAQNRAETTPGPDYLVDQGDTPEYTALLENFKHQGGEEVLAPPPAMIQTKREARLPDFTQDNQEVTPGLVRPVPTMAAGPQAIAPEPVDQSIPQSYNEQPDPLVVPVQTSLGMPSLDAGVPGVENQARAEAALQIPALDANASIGESRVGTEASPASTLPLYQAQRQITEPDSVEVESLTDRNNPDDPAPLPRESNQGQPQAKMTESIGGVQSANPGEAGPEINSIQRQMAPPAADTRETTSAPDAPAGKTETQQTSIDTDELARRVYSKIRNRLAVEWERIRQR